MALKIKDKYVKQLASSYKLSKNGNSTGDYGNEKVLVNENFKTRIVGFSKTGDYSANSITDIGIGESVTHIAVCDTDLLFEAGHLVVCNNKEYIVEYVDDAPGGELEHHKELYLKYISR
jgi:hypothetical protein